MVAFIEAKKQSSDISLSKAIRITEFILQSLPNFLSTPSKDAIQLFKRERNLSSSLDSKRKDRIESFLPNDSVRIDGLLMLFQGVNG